jgi:predicted membrane metal-binding protein
MTTVNLSSIQWSFNSQTKSILISEREIPFATTYNVISPKTGVGKVFNFSHSTGPEFDPTTQWIYTSEDGTLLSVSNDPAMVKQAARNYLKAKMSNM